MKVVLISTYELGRQPFGLASPAAWLKRLGAEVHCRDLSVQRLVEEAVREAALICVYIPMHTATRMAAKLMPRLKELNPDAHFCFFGLYAPVNEGYLRSLGGQSILGGEFEAGLAALYRDLSKAEKTAPYRQSLPSVSLEKLDFIVPDRTQLPPLEKYAYLTVSQGDTRVVGYTEATRGCKHRCRHCPVVPVYDGRFRAVPVDVVLEDIARQVAMGAQHITFGDPDFLNGPTHARKVVEGLHARFPQLTYDVTIKIEHLVKHADLLPTLKNSGCLFITSAVESIDPEILEIFDKGHTREEFEFAVRRCRELDLALSPTFVTFTPWTTIKGYLELLETILAMDLVENISPIQYAIRLLIPAGSRLLELDRTREIIDAFDRQALVYPWRHPEPAVDRLYERVLVLVKEGQDTGKSRLEIFSDIWETAQQVYKDFLLGKLKPRKEAKKREPVPQLSESWYC